MTIDFYNNIHNHFVNFIHLTNLIFNFILTIKISETTVGYMWEVTVQGVLVNSALIRPLNIKGVFYRKGITITCILTFTNETDTSNYVC